jgi:hypothetical protein
MRTVTGTVVTIALLGPLVSVSAAADRQVANPLRARQASSDADGYRLATDNLTTSRFSSGTAALRADSMIPPTEGRIVRQGADWIFVAEYPEFAAVIVPKPARQQAPANAFRTAATIAKVADVSVLERRASFFGTTLDQPESAGLPENSLREDRLENQLFAFDQHSDEGYEQAFPEKIVLADNLMLRRITSRQDFDTSDERWMITGLITDDRGQRCLQIHTADPLTPQFPFPAP